MAKVEILAKYEGDSPNYDWWTEESVKRIGNTIFHQYYERPFSSNGGFCRDAIHTMDDLLAIRWLTDDEIAEISELL